MTLKRVILIVLTIGIVFSVGLRLWESWSQPQFQSRLELYQTNLVLQATERRGASPGEASAQKALLGNEPLKAAIEQYTDFRESVQKNLKRAQTQKSPDAPQTGTAIAKLNRLAAEVDLRTGLLQAKQGDGQAAEKTWNGIVQQNSGNPTPLSQTAAVLIGLWSNPPQLLPNGESLLKQNLDSWFRFQALSRLYELQQRSDSLAQLQSQEQEEAEQAFNTLAIIGGLPILGCLLGVGILLFLGGQWLVQRKQSYLVLANLPTWSVPWDGEIVWQVLVFGFFLVGQILLPFLLEVIQLGLGFNPATLGERAKAAYILMDYLLLTAGGLGVLYLSIQPFFPLPEGWFRFSLRGNWLLWGVGGYFAALPLVILVSLLNQLIWQGQGGSNPILPIALDNRDNVALAIFFLTAAVAAPLFEETLFRGFLLPSLSRYIPMWGAIALSALIFALAHLNLSEVLPLATLGMVLGFVYVRSGNLLSSILLHSLWNSGTLLSLIVLGNSGS
jgi:membrane protease YdiL (CAAX protease family)